MERDSDDVPIPLSPKVDDENQRQEEVRVSTDDELEEVNSDDEIEEVPMPPQDARDCEIVDLTGDDDGDDYSFASNSRMSMGSGGYEGCRYNVIDWRNNSVDYPLWHNSSQFRELANPFIELVERYGESCYYAAHEDFSRDSTVTDFACFCLWEVLPTRDWYGELVLVNTERRGWPLQYAAIGKVYIEGEKVNEIGRDRFDSDGLRWKYLVGDKLVEAGGPNVADVKWWRFTLTEIGEEEKDFHDLEAAKEVLATVRKLMDCVYFPFDPENFTTFYNHVLYERLVLLFYLEHPSPTNGILSDFDRSRIISSIKLYHQIKNSIIKVYPNHKAEDDGRMENKDGVGSKYLETSTDDEMREEDESDINTVKYGMEMKRHTLEMSFLLSPGIRPLLPFASTTDDSDPVSLDEMILVMKETNVQNLKLVYEEIEKCGVKGDANIRILPDLETALKKGIAGTTIYVTSGNYNVSGLWKLSDGGSIIGIKTSNSDITISPSDAIGDVWFFIDGKESTLKLKNLTLVVDTSIDDRLKSTINVNKGQLIMENCVLRDNNVTSKDQAVVSIAKSEGATVNVDETCVFSNIQNFPKS